MALPKSCKCHTSAFPVQDEVEPLQQVRKGGTMEDALAAKTQAVEELSRELEEIRAAFGTEGVQQVNALITSFKVILSLSISFSSSCTLRLNICQCI